MQALKVCPVRPRVLSSWGITLPSSAKSLVQLGNTFNKRIKRLKLINTEKNLKTIVTCCVCLSSLCNKKLQLGNNFVREAESCRWELKARNSAVQLCATSIYYHTYTIIRLFSQEEADPTSAVFESSCNVRTCLPQRVEGSQCCFSYYTLSAETAANSTSRSNHRNSHLRNSNHSKKQHYTR